MHLALLSYLYTEIFFEVKGLTWHDGFGADTIWDSSFHWKELYHLHRVDEYMSSQELWNALEKKAVHCSFTTLIHLSTSRLCSFATAKFTSGPLVGTLSGSLKDRTCRLHALWWYGSHYIGNTGIPPWKLWIFLVLYNLLYDWLPWSISSDSTSGILGSCSQKMLHVRNTSLYNFINSKGIFTWFLDTIFWLLQVVMHFNAAISPPHNVCATSTFWTITGQFLIWFLKTPHL